MQTADLNHQRKLWPQQKEQQRLSFGPSRQNNQPSSLFSWRRRVIIPISSCPDEAGDRGLLYQPSQQSTEGYPTLSGYSCPNWVEQSSYRCRHCRPSEFPPRSIVLINILIGYGSKRHFFDIYGRAILFVKRGFWASKDLNCSTTMGTKI